MSHYCKVWVEAIKHGSLKGISFGGDSITMSINVGYSVRNTKRFCTVSIDYIDNDTKACIKVDDKVIKVLNLME